MAFIRRVRTASGATAVQIPEYADGRQRIVKHVGSAHTEAELGMLFEQARGLLADPGQDALDLGVTPTPRVAELSADPGEQGVLDLVSTPVVQRRDEPGRVVSTDSRLLHETVAGVFTGLGFGVVEDAVFQLRRGRPGRALRHFGRRTAPVAIVAHTTRYRTAAPPHHEAIGGRVRRRGVCLAVLPVEAGVPRRNASAATASRPSSRSTTTSALCLAGR